MRKYEHIFFDLDHTLWDFSANCAETLTDLYHRHHLDHLKISLPDFITYYRQINDKMWDDLHQGKVTIEEVRNHRFARTFHMLGLQESDVPPGLDEQFISLCPTKSNVFPYTHDILDYLSERYVLHILTNGFRETQRTKLRSAGIEHYFQQVIHSDESGFMKPDKRMFDYALHVAGITAHQCLMIGDDLYADVLGAKNAGIDHVFVNRLDKQHQEVLTYEIDCLSTLKTFL
ncbi:MAG TPA: YjjG family noncanonical pyrimidine nucleotidase [Cytophagaceae bacterium]|jgi:putative hydrolase of the HAD superfamily|nr:YjjG family noncanonical pyrimidine nucleotidase [Cytophagaceae bacterium]